MESNWLAAFNFNLVDLEGGKVYTQDPNDPGKGTYAGVTQATWEGMSYPGPVYLATDAQLQYIYQAGYWFKGQCPFLPSGLDIAVFQACVNPGPGWAVKALQGIIGAYQDGAWGPQSQAALVAYLGTFGARSLAASFLDAQENRYRTTIGTPGYAPVMYLQGLLNRVDKTRSFIQGYFTDSVPPSKQSDGATDTQAGTPAMGCLGLVFFAFILLAGGAAFALGVF